ncbi:MAG TPA: hypothetical protein PLR20_06455 [Syntrophales bacterium]|jgi:hypothetical protein|nr:hypothetical protein [Syntrophales bacterium]HPI56157.1 hypothetical protein [Syntrophales bacterium]HPN24345.1 hypothetical protein [Syntrophales bacterium]HQM28975.1 hypothetical protein [Syntrophales bacterium]
MKTASLIVLTILSFFLLPSLIHADSVWVLWKEVEFNAIKDLKENMRTWSVESSATDFETCMNIMKNKKEETARFSKKYSKVTDPPSFESYVVFMPDTPGLTPGFSIIRFHCLPETIDPREKAK